VLGAPSSYMWLRAMNARQAYDDACI